jgi:MscS family membrane protein
VLDIVGWGTELQRLPRVGFICWNRPWLDDSRERVSFGLPQSSFLFRAGPLDLLGWQWLAIPVVALLAMAIGSLLSRVTRAILGRATRRTTTAYDDAILSRLGKPLTVGWAIACAYGMLVPLELNVRAADLIHRWLKAFALIVFFWALARGVDVAQQQLAGSAWIRERPGTRSLLTLGAKFGQVFLLAVGIVALLSELGYPVASLLAGLGIGGLAVALAAQKTLENLFGALALGADQPFREGDFVSAEGLLVGTVESIGLRSTRIRTLDRTVISIPNGKLAELRLESFAVRDRLRFVCPLGLVLYTTEPQMRAVLSGIDAALRAQPKLWPEGVTVRFKEIGQFSLNLDISAWFGTTDWDEFVLIREELLLRFLRIVEEAGTALALPARHVRLVGAAVPQLAELPASAGESLPCGLIPPRH